jgi:N-acetylgalactosamine-6-sulfatase
MTGRYPASFGQLTKNRGFDDSATVTELLARNGYRTGHFGKWHIGPVDRDGTYGIFEIEKGTVRTNDPAGRDADIFAAAIEFIENNQDAPFYVNIWGHITHNPINPPAALFESFREFDFDRGDFGFWAQENFDKSQFLIDKYRLQDDLAMAMRKYLSEIWALDRQVGLLLNKLDELGLRGRTLVVFASDQGPACPFGGDKGYNRNLKNPDIRKNNLGYAGGLRGGKHKTYEGGVRAPFIVRWPGRIPAKRINRTSIVSAVDFLPTICALAGIELDPAAGRLDGEDVSDIWLGSNRRRSGPIFWKTAKNRSRPTMRSGDWKIIDRGSNTELYNLAEDPFEMDNQAGSRQDVVDRLRLEISSWMATLPESYATGRVKSPESPIADAGPNQTIIDDDGDGKVWVKLDASGSSDPDGYLSGYVWLLAGEQVAVSRSPFVRLPLGEHRLTLRVTDYAKKTATDQVLVSVVR